MAGTAGCDAPICFGTSGWRGILGEEITFPRLRVALHGIARWLAREAGREVVVAHDTRFLGERMADLAARILAEHGARPVLGKGALPTPVAARAVLRRGAAGAVVLTASHNPAEYHGLKVLGAWGGGIDDATARRIEGWIARARPVEPAAGPPLRPVDLRAPYLRELLRCLDRERLERARLRVVYDAMHGAGAGVLDTALERLGARVELHRGEPDPRFGGLSPDPTRERLQPLARALRGRRGRWLGLATDGDADRFAAVDADGRVLSETEAAALLVDHLARSGRARRGVAISSGAQRPREARRRDLDRDGLVGGTDRPQPRPAGAASSDRLQTPLAGAGLRGGRRGRRGERGLLPRRLRVRQGRDPGGLPAGRDHGRDKRAAARAAGRVREAARPLSVGGSRCPRKPVRASCSRGCARPRPGASMLHRCDA